jgi:hypothetical protein
MRHSANKKDFIISEVNFLYLASFSFQAIFFNLLLLFRDYAMYMAIASSKQGEHGSRVMDKYRKNVGKDVPLSKLCAKNPAYLAKYPHH